MTIQCILCKCYESKTRIVEKDLVYHLEKKLIGINYTYATKGVCKKCLEHFQMHIPQQTQPVLLEFSAWSKPTWFLSKPMSFFQAIGHQSDGLFYFSFGWLRTVYNLNKTERPDYLPVSITRTLPKRCEKCGSSKNLEIHHIQPLCFGGSNERENLQVLCKTCHADAGLKFPSSVTFDFIGMLKNILESEYNTNIICYKAIKK